MVTDAAGQGDRADAKPPPSPPRAPVSTLTVLLFETYFLLLAIGTAYALWSIWPRRGAPSTVPLFGLLIDFKNDSETRLLLLAMISALLLILDVVIGLGPAVLLAAVGLAWFATWWFVLPVWSRIRHKSHTGLIDALDKESSPATGG